MGLCVAIFVVFHSPIPSSTRLAYPSKVLELATFSPESQTVAERKIREPSIVNYEGDLGFSPSLGWMNGRFAGPVEDPS
jgi:hypothetical protein